jgi:hypothetical protein
MKKTFLRILLILMVPMALSAQAPTSPTSSQTDSARDIFLEEIIRDSLTKEKTARDSIKNNLKQNVSNDPASTFGELPLGSESDSVNNPTSPTQDTSEVLPDDNSQYLGEETVVGKPKQNLHEIKSVSKRTLSRQEMKTISATLNDPMRTISTLPGVSNQSDLSVRPFIRGGDARESKVFWNGIPLIQPFHAMSYYSVFSMEATENLRVYSGSFPVDGSNSLSGAIYLDSRPPSTDSLQAVASVSMERASLYLSKPIIPDRFAIYLATQGYLYDFVVKRFMDVLDIFIDDTSFEEEVEDYKKFVNLPNFRDFEFGWNWTPHRNFSINYTAIYSRDEFKVLDPISPFQEDNSYGNVSRPSDDSLINVLRKIDTLAFVEIPNTIHGMQFHYRPAAHWQLQLLLARQSSNWHVSFENDAMKFTLNQDSWHENFKAKYSQDNWDLNLGFSLDSWKNRYNTDLVRPAYEMLVNGNIDLMESMGYYAPEGAVFTQDSLIQSVGDLSQLIIMRYKGENSSIIPALYVGHNWYPSAKDRLESGMRLEYEWASSDFFPAPRIAWYHSLAENRELSLAAGLYSQNTYPFYYRVYNEKLKSEKAAHINGEWSWDFYPGWALELAIWSKYYFDLATPDLKRLDNLARNLIDADILNAFLDVEELSRETGLNEYEIEELFYEGAQAALELLNEEDQALVLDALGERRLDFHNNGYGLAMGTELSFRYKPADLWSGWFSLELSRSGRTEDDLDFWYPFRHHRPWAVKWHNFFKMPNKFEISLRYQLQAGMYYTGYTDFAEMADMGQNDTLFLVERKNKEQYDYYNRLDIRIAKNDTLFGHPFVSYFEIWNALNEPNLILRDHETKHWVWFDFNYPFPVIFSGFEWRW